MSPPNGDLLDDIALLALRPGGAGTRTAEPLIIEYERDLTSQDIDVLNNVPVGSKPSAVQKLRYSHHMMARLIASGKAATEVAAIMGHSAGTVYRLSESDPAFRELVSHYKAASDQHALEAAGRLAVLGTTAVEILQERLEESPDSFKVRELTEVVEMAFDRSVAPSKGTGGSVRQGNGAGVNVNVTFVSPRAPTDEQPVIDVTPTPQLEPPPQ